ncbi:MAG: Eco57I restriction-modification methylase domain-containing protein [bacterium]
MQNILKDIIENFEAEKFIKFFRDKSRQFSPSQENFSRYDNDEFKNGLKIGEINFSDSGSLLICAFEVKKNLTERAGKKAQYDKAKAILKSDENRKFSAGIFIFYDSPAPSVAWRAGERGNFRFSLVYDIPKASGRRDWNNYKRFTYFVSSDPQITNKTFKNQISACDFLSLDKIKEVFSISAVTDIFYKEFFVEYNKVVEAVKNANKIDDYEKARDFVLLFAIRTVFLGFIQKKGWIGNDDKFISNLFAKYEEGEKEENGFYKNWLSLLFFESFNNHKFFPCQNLSKEVNQAFQMAPYLNGGLFREKEGYDTNDWHIPDEDIKHFFDFLFSHSFTIEENSVEDEDLQLNPEFLGIIFERLVNKADGAVYTPRTEVDLMCRLSLVKWLQKNISLPVEARNLYELFFKEGVDEEDQKTGSFSPKETHEILRLLENAAICDPAAVSGAFLVGMAQVLDEIECSLKNKIGVKNRDAFDRKKAIIANCLYGVEVKEWAVWICQLRLWLSLFIDAPDDLRNSLEPILPSLDFKVRQGDSLVQKVGSKLFPVSGHIQIQNKSIKDKIIKLKNLKLEYFENKTALQDRELKHREETIYAEILDYEIKLKKDELRELKYKLRSGINLFGEEDNGQSPLELNKGKIENLEKEIEDFKEQKRVLKKDKPLVWGIEFAEIFVEKDGFDIIIGNPPYVRQEAISDPTGKIKDKKEYKKLLEETVKMDFPDDFPQKAKINAQSDIYTYFYIRGLRLLNQGGIHTFICSNSWLDVGYGVWLQEFLLKRAAVDCIIDNHAKRSFEAADVNTIISIIHAPLQGRKKQVQDNHLIKFIAFKKPFEEAIFTENLLEIERVGENNKSLVSFRAKSTPSKEGIGEVEESLSVNLPVIPIISNGIFRVYPISNTALKEAGTEYEGEKSLGGGKYVGDKWGGKYLRAPDIFFTILEKGKDKLVKLGDIAEVRRGFTTGVNEFFYLTSEQAREWKIEEEFLKPVIKSPRECKSIIINPADLKYKIFMCNKSKSELAGTNALKYIEWGERQKTKDGMYWKDVPSVQGRKYWYGLGERKKSSLVIPCSFNDNFKIFKNRVVLVDKRMYEGDSNSEHIILMLNSTLFPLFMELGSRLGLGEGLLDVTVEEVQKIKVVNSKFINTHNIELPKRFINPIFEECGIDPKSKIPIEKQEPSPLPDRAELDKIVFDALGLTTEERKQVYPPHQIF